jgi:hypothetical protein
MRHFELKNLNYKDLLTNLIAEITGILITLIIVERIIKKREKSKWSELYKRLDEELNSILISIYHVLSFHVKRLEESAKIYSSNNGNKQKVDMYNELFNGYNIDNDYLDEVIKDDHLFEFFINSYQNIFIRLNNFYNEFNSRLNHMQVPFLIDLKSSISRVIFNINYFHDFSKIIKTMPVNLTSSYSSYIKEDVNKIIDITLELSKI